MAKKVSLPVVNYDESVLNPDVQSASKMGPCKGCLLEPKGRVCGSGATGEVDIMLVSESPSSWSVNNQEVFYGRGGRIIRNTWKQLRELDDKTGGKLKIRHLRRWDTYAVQCQVGEGRDESATINKDTLARCSNYLRSAIKNKKPKVILVFGANALKALGYKGDKFMEARGRVLDMTFDDHTVQVLPTFSTKHVTAKTGLFNLFYNDFSRALRLASGVDKAATQTSLEEATKDYRFPKTVQEVGALVDEIIGYVVEGAKSAAQCALALDTETNTLKSHHKDSKVLCISVAWDTGKAAAWPLWHKDSWWSPAELEEVLGHVRRLFECAKPKMFHNAKFDLKFLELRHRLKINNLVWDTMLGEHLLREDQSGAYSLKILGRSYFPEFASYADKVHELASGLTVEEEAVRAALEGVKKGKIKKDTPGFDEGMVCEWGKADLEDYLFDSKKDRKKKAFDSGYERIPMDTLLLYAAIDTDVTRRLMRHQFVRMREENFMHAKNLMLSHCIPATRTLGKMEYGGIRVDLPYLTYLETELKKVVTEKGEKLKSYWDPARTEEFNPNSTHHVAYLLFNYGIGPNRMLRLGPWVERNKKSQQWKTDKKTLRAIAEKTDCEFTKTLLDYRAAHKAESGFIHDIKLLSADDGYLHTNFHIHGTSTGRLSSSDLNMQNLPEWLAGFNIKKIFIPDDPESEVIFNADAKGAEIKVFTAYARDEKLIQALNDGLDVHSFFTQEIYKIAYEVVANHEALKDTDPEQYLYLKKTRTNVKRVVFGILYGAMAKKIAETAGISEEEAQDVINRLFEKFPSLKNYMDETVAQIHQRGFVETLFGRRRRFPLQGVNGFFRGQAERRGKNMKIQSTSSDIVISQLCELDEHIAEMGGRLLITVHDSVVGTLKKKYLGQFGAFMKHYCVDRVAQKYPWLPVAFSWDVGVGPSYGETVAIDKYLKQEQRNISADEALYIELDNEALEDLREDEEEKAEREAIAVAVGGSG